MAFDATGTVFSFPSGTPVAEMVEHSISIEGKEIDVTSHDSGGWEEILMGRKRYEIKVDGNYVPSDAGMQAIVNSLLNGTVSTWKLTYPNGYYYSGSGYVASVEIKSPEGDKAAVSLTLKGSGALTSGSGS